MTRVLAVASEIFPLVKTGGLADVTGALPAGAGGRPERFGDHDDAARLSGGDAGAAGRDESASFP